MQILRTRQKFHELPDQLQHESKDTKCACSESTILWLPDVDVERRAKEQDKQLLLRPP